MGPASCLANGGKKKKSWHKNKHIPASAVVTSAEAIDSVTELSFTLAHEAELLRPAQNSRFGVREA